MILQILADAGQRHLDRDVVCGEFGRIADAGQHQQLRRVDDAAADNHLALGMRGDGGAMFGVFDACRALAVENDLVGMGVDFDGEVRSSPAPAADRRPLCCSGGRP